MGGAAGGAGGATDKGVKTPAGTVETGVAASSGVGASDGLPTTSDSGEITMTMHQCNQDGAGPFNAQIDATSGGVDMAAFKEAEVTQNVPGIAAGFSAATTTDYAVKVQMPAGMTCSGTVGSAQNVCVVRMANKTPAGMFPPSHTLISSLSFSFTERHGANSLIRTLRWCRCIHPVSSSQETRHRVQPLQAPHGTQAPLQEELDSLFR